MFYCVTLILLESSTFKILRAISFDRVKNRVIFLYFLLQPLTQACDAGNNLLDNEDLAQRFQDLAGAVVARLEPWLAVGPSISFGDLNIEFENRIFSLNVPRMYEELNVLGILGFLLKFVEFCHFNLSNEFFVHTA